MLLVAAAVVVGAQALGTLLVVAILVAPAATRAAGGAAAARRCSRSRVGVAIAAGVAGIELSYHAGTAAGASIALCLVGAYLVAVRARPAATVGARAA